MVDVGTMREHLDMACVSASEWAKNIGALLDEVEELRRENASLSDELACHRTQAERDRKNVMPDDWAKTLGECVDLAGGFRDEPWSLERGLNIVRDALRTRLMPEGMEWPRYTDGKPVRPLDTVYARLECGPWAKRAPKKVTQIAFADPERHTVRIEYDYRSGYEPNDTYGFLRVPPEMLGADEEPIKIGETVYDISHNDPSPLTVVELGEGLKRNGCNVLVRNNASGEQWRHFNTCLTHERPKTEPPATESQGCRDSVAGDS